MIEDSKVLVRHFKKTGLNRNLSITLKQEVSTRFNSVCQMLVSISRSYEEIKYELAKSDELHFLTNIKRKLLDSVYKERHRFEVATQKLAVEKEGTLHLAVPVFKELEIKLTRQMQMYSTAGDSEMAALCKHLISSMKDKCTAKLTWYHCVANFLDLQRRDCPDTSLASVERNRVISDLREITSKFDSIPAGSSQPKKVKWLLSDSDSGEENEDDSDDETFCEVDEYLKIQFTSDDDNYSPLQYWKSQSHKFPRLSSIARSVLSIPATQNKAERSFSAAGNTATELRTCLEPEHLRELLLVRSYHKSSSEAR